jgi:CRISPR-associated protein Csm2
MAYFHDDKGNLHPDLLDGRARGKAEQFVPAGDRRNRLSSAQLRRFYNEFKSLERKLVFSSDKGVEEQEAFTAIFPLVKMVKSKVAYAEGRNTVPRPFKIWIEENVDHIENVDDFKAFLLHFEAVVGFCYGLGLKD